MRRRQPYQSNPFVNFVHGPLQDEWLIAMLALNSPAANTVGLLLWKWNRMSSQGQWRGVEIKPEERDRWGLAKSSFTRGVRLLKAAGLIEELTPNKRGGRLFRILPVRTAGALMNQANGMAVLDTLG